MNRPIKFRAFDRHGGEVWIPVKDIAFRGDATLVRFGDGDEDVRIVSRDNDGADGGVVLVQFTGLTDKNGKEIYEGDVVSIKNGVTGEHIQNGVVKWYPAFFDIEVNGKMHCVDAGVFERSEVIGNIYENPELLTDV